MYADRRLWSFSQDPFARLLPRRRERRHSDSLDAARVDSAQQVHSGVRRLGIRSSHVSRKKESFLHYLK